MVKIIMPEFLEVCEDAVRAAGAVILDLAGRAEAWEKGPKDLVTQADFASQEVVRQAVLSAFPDHGFLGEEGQHSAREEVCAEYRWIVDPLDGTLNFVHGIPHYSVSLALERGGEILVGAVFDPHRKECYTAIAGQGARLNGRPIHTSRVAELSQCLAAASFPAQVRRDSPDLLTFIEAVMRCQAIRRTGSSALNLCYIAAGRLDLFWSFSTKVWDVAAGALIVREAGGLVTAPDGGPFVLDSGHFLAAANEPLRAKFQPLMPASASLAGDQPIAPGLNSVT